MSLYYPPDLSAGSFRAGPLVDALLDRMEEGSKLDVLTSSPTRYSSYKVSAPDTERRDGLTITRFELPLHNNGFRGQIASYARFAWAVLRATRGKKYDIVIGTSSRLMTASLASIVARRCGAALCLDIRDIFVDTIGDVFPKRISFLAVPFFSIVEKLTIRRALVVNLVSEGFKGYFEPRYPNTKFTYLSNGIDDDFLSGHVDFGKETAKRPSDGTPVQVLYAGNIGEGQGLERVLPAFAEQLKNEIEIHIFGDGAARRKLELEIAARNLDNIILHEPVQRAALIEKYREADLLFLHLNDYEAFTRVLPSKLFEYAATGKPILAGLGGYSGQFGQKHISNIGLFKPCDADGAVLAYRSLKLEQTDRSNFTSQFGRRAMSRRLAEVFLP